MAKQEYKILEFHGGTNNKFDPRDIADNQNVFSSLSIRHPGRLVVEGDAKNLYDKTDINGAAITDITTASGGFEKGYGLFSFSHDYSMESTPTETDTDFIVINDDVGIDIYDANQTSDEWQNDKFKLGSRTGAVKPEYYNVDGALRVCDSNFLTTDVAKNTDAIVYKNDITVTTESSTTIATGSVIQINQAIMYVTKGVAAGTSISVIRGFANTKIAQHGNDDDIFYVNVPKYFGHIKQNRMLEADTSDSINAWAADIQTPQPPNNTRSGTYFRTTSELINDGAVSAAAGVGWTVGTGWTYDTSNDKLTYNGTQNSALLTQTLASSLYAGSVYTFRFTVATDTLELTFNDSSDNTLVAKTVYAVGTHHITLRPTVDSATLKILAGDTDEDAASIVGSTAVSCTELEFSPSAGIQSLRVYDEITSSTTNFPAESEKVILELGQSEPDYGIIEVDIDGDEVTITTSAEHGLTNGDEILISNVQSDISELAGTHTVQTDISQTEFTLIIEDHGISELDWSTVANYAEISGWADYKDTKAGTVRATIADSEVASGKTWIHITGVTGVTSYNGVKLTTYVGGTQFYFSDENHGDAGSASTGAGTKAQELLGTITKPGEDAIDEDLKRKWNFAMSFTYDGPAQEVQESLLTQGYKITELEAADGTANELAAAMSDTTTTANHDVDDASVFSVGDVIMVGTEQMQITAVDTSASPDHINVTRGYNGSTASTHSNGDQILLVEELSPTATVDWTNFTVAPKCVIKTNYDHGVANKTWNPRINGFKIYMRDVTDGDASKEWRLFSHVNFNKGTYTIFAADDSELILEQPASGTLATLTTGTTLKIKPIDTYLSENLFTEQTIIDAQYKVAEVVGRRVYIGNIKQGGRTYPDRMLRSPVNKFDTFPETNFIDVAVGDGDRITALKSFGDRLLQYKKDTVYIINTSGESEVLEAEYPNAGVAKPSQVVKTNLGIAWFNPTGLWFFDGKAIQNLTRNIESNQYHDHETNIGIIGFDKYTNRLIYTSRIFTGIQTIWYMYDLELKSYQRYYFGDLFPYSESGGNNYTNIITDSDGNMIVGYVDNAEPTELNFYQWSNSAAEGGVGALVAGTLWKSKDIDVVGVSSSGSPVPGPAVNKKIYKVYVTYKCTGHSGVKMTYATDGSGSFSGTFAANTNYNAESFTTNGTHTGFKNTDGVWTVAELKPSSSINNVKSIQLHLDYIYIASGTAQTGGGTSSIKLAAAASATAGIYNDYNINLYAGNARYNTGIIENGTNGTTYSPDGSSRVATVLSTFTDRGYGNDANSTSTKYILGGLATDFEINDITIIFRPKRVK